jgi:hypothetical protein
MTVVKLASSSPDEAAHAVIAGQHVRLGKLQTKKDRRNLKFAKYLPKGVKLPKAPGHVSRVGLVPSWPMYGNDTLGDCTCAAVGHIDQLASVAGGKPETPTDQAVLDLYWQTGTADDGRYCLDILNRWHTHGFGADLEKLTVFAQVDPTQRQQAKLAVYWLGFLYIGLALPISAQQQSHWSIVRGANAKPGSWGGHCVPVVGYDGNGLDVVTWGKVIRMTWGFFAKYCDEAYTVLVPDWFQSGHSPADAGALKLDAMLADLAKIGS